MPAKLMLLKHLAIVNALSAILLVTDKALAILGVYRIPESLLLLLAALGGWCAGFPAMILFKHKIRKIPFLVCYSLSACLSVVAYAYIFVY